MRETKAMESVASSFGLRSGLRQGGKAFRPVFLRHAGTHALPVPGTAKSGCAGLRWEGFAVDERTANSPSVATNYEGWAIWLSRCRED
jgi:hypothetical protein